jgi:hypothetical protein
MMFNLIYHLKQSLSEVMKWPASFRDTMWSLYLEQLKIEGRLDKEDIT